MRETHNERLVREAAREVASEAIGRIRSRLREVQADEFTMRLYEAEWGADGRAWPTQPMMAWEWVPYLLEDLSRAEAELNACHRY
jgi:hypothetical protein